MRARERLRLTSRNCLLAAVLLSAASSARAQNLAVTINQAPATGMTGQAITYKFDVSSAGGSSTSVLLSDILPPGMTLATGSSTGCLGNGNTVTCTLGTVSSTVVTVTIVLQSSAGGPLKHAVGVIGGEPDSDLSNNYKIVSTTFTGPAPTLTTVSPTSGSGSGGQAVTLTGTNFVPGATVTFGGTQATVGTITATSIQVTTPAKAAGAVNVVVTNPDGQFATKTSGYTFVALSAFSLTANGVTGTSVTTVGNAVVGLNVTLTAAAPGDSGLPVLAPPGASVGFFLTSPCTSDLVAYPAPNTMIIPTGSSGQKTVNVGTTAVNANTTCTINATYGGVTKQASLTLTKISPEYILYGNPTNSQPHENAGYEVGVRLKVDQNGWITALRFYKSPGESPGHTGRLWRHGFIRTDPGPPAQDIYGAIGSPLSTATFQNETTSGWQEAPLIPAVYVASNEEYVVSYTPNAWEFKGGSATFDAPPLHALSGCFSPTPGAGNPPECNTGFGNCVVESPDSCSSWWVDARLRPSNTRAIFYVENPKDNISAEDPTTPVQDDPNVGTAFTATQAGSITALRFYKSSGETGTHTAHLWDVTVNQAVGEPGVTFTETLAGWQEKAFPSPIPVVVGHSYVVWVKTFNYIVKTPVGSAGQLTSGLFSAPLIVPADGGRYHNTNTPPDSSSKSNFYVDVRFQQQ